MAGLAARAVGCSSWPASPGSPPLMRSWRPMVLAPVLSEEPSLSVLGRLGGHQARRHLAPRAAEVRLRVRKHSRVRPVDRQRNHAVARDLEADLRLEGSLDLALLHADVRVRPVEDDPDALDWEGEELQGLEA